MNVLIVEDDEKIVSLLKKGLGYEGIVSEFTPSGDKALEKLDSYDYDLIVLDIMLAGDKDGFEVCKIIREKGITTPIIMVTARESIEDRIKGLDIGADDYLPKPFSLPEFLARVRALSRRGSKVDRPILQIADLTLDPSSHSVERAGVPIKLSKKEFRLLEYLMRNKNRVLTRVMLIEHIWGYKVDYSTKVVDVYINYLRQKIEKGFGKKLIYTIRGIGYMMKD